MKKNYLLVVVLGFIFICNSTLFAHPTCCHGPLHSRAGAATFTFASGYDFFSSKRHIENTTIPFVALGYDFTNRWGIEALYGFFNTNFKQSVPDDRQIRGALFAVDVLYHFCPYKIIEPYLLGGVGITGLNPNRNWANNEGNVNVGAGFLLFASEVVALRLEARDFYTTVGAKNDIYLDGGVTFFLDL